MPSSGVCLYSVYSRTLSIAEKTFYISSLAESGRLYDRSWAGGKHNELKEYPVNFYLFLQNFISGYRNYRHNFNPFGLNSNSHLILSLIIKKSSYKNVGSQKQTEIHVSN